MGSNYRSSLSIIVVGEERRPATGATGGPLILVLIATPDVSTTATMSLSEVLETAAEVAMGSSGAPF